MIFVFKEGKVIEIIGEGKVAERFRKILTFENNEKPYISARKCVESS